jgi:hypothetical protein
MNLPALPKAVSDYGKDMGMEKNSAKLIIDLMLEISCKLNESIFIVMETETADDVDIYKQNIGSLMSDILLDIILPLTKKHPDLTPKHLRTE